MSDRRLVYVTARLPQGDGEAFVVTEALALERAGWEVTVVPVRGSGAVVHGDAKRLRSEAVPLVSARILWVAVAEAFANPRASLGAFALLRSSRSARILLKNLSVLPKALWLGRYARRAGVQHLHAHWASTSSTMAMGAARVAGISWSLTAHRWDIGENNLLRTKAGSARFVRVISEHGARELRQLVGDPQWAPWILHMGVALPAEVARPASREGPLRVVTAARLVEKKGHAFLIEALGILRSREVSVRLELVGGGPLERALREQVEQAGLSEDVRFLGTVSHDELLDRLAAGDWDVAALSSVVTASGELEGIPVSLIEAMAHGLPALGTSTGGIPELLGGGAGVLVPPADPQALAEALERFARDEELRRETGVAGRRRVEEQFDVDRIARQLSARFTESA